MSLPVGGMIRGSKYGSRIQENLSIISIFIRIGSVPLHSVRMDRFLLVGVMIRLSSCGTGMQKDCFAFSLVILMPLILSRSVRMGKFLLVGVMIRLSRFGERTESKQSNHEASRKLSLPCQQAKILSIE